MHPQNEPLSKLKAILFWQNKLAEKEINCNIYQHKW